MRCNTAFYCTSGKSHVALYMAAVAAATRGFKWFLQRDAMHKRGLCRHAVSVRLSVTFVDHVKTNKHIFEIFSPSGSHTILVFPYQTGWRYSDGNPPNGDIECRWGIGKNRDSGLIAGYRRLLDVRSAKNIYRRRS